MYIQSHRVPTFFLFQSDATTTTPLPSGAKSNNVDEFLLVDESNEESISVEAPALKEEADELTDLSDTTEEGDLEEDGKSSLKKMENLIIIKILLKSSIIMIKKLSSYITLRTLNILFPVYKMLYTGQCEFYRYSGNIIMGRCIKSQNTLIDKYYCSYGQHLERYVWTSLGKTFLMLFFFCVCFCFIFFFFFFACCFVQNNLLVAVNNI